MKYSKIALIGMPGAGKSAVCTLLAKKTGFNLFELDDIFEKEQNIKIKDFFQKFGEEKFRKIESDILLNTLKYDNCAISCGGGIILKEKNRKLLFNDDVFTIYLSAKIETIYERIKKDTSRPLLAVLNPKEEIKKILSTREKYYNLANLKIETDNKSIEKIAEEIFEWIKQK